MARLRTRLKVGVLISGRGSNLQALIDACARSDYPAEIAVVVSNDATAYGLNRADAAGIATETIDHGDYDSRETFESAINRVLSDRGFITGFRAILDPVRLGRDHIAFAEVKLSSTTETALRAFNEAVARVPEIEECHMIAGAFDYLLKVRTEDIKAYRRVLGEQISALPHVAATSTHVSMQAVKDRGL